MTTLLLLALIALARPRGGRGLDAPVRPPALLTCCRWPPPAIWRSPWWRSPTSSPSSLGGWLALDPPGRLVLLLLSVLFAICAVYAVGYLRYRRELSNRVFVPCLLVFLGDDDPGRVLAAPRAHVGRGRGGDARDGPADLLQPDAAVDRGDLEIPAGRIGRHRAGAARIVLPRLRLARCRTRRSCFATCSRARIR